MDSVLSRRGVIGRLMSLAKGAARRVAVDRLGLPRGALRNLESFSRLSGSAASSLPTELLGLAADMWSGFIYTPFAEQQMHGWVMPYWLTRQRTPSSGSFVPHGHFWLECNMTHRNWTGIGLCGFPYEATVDPRGLLTPWPFSPSVDVWIMADGRLACPSELDAVEQSLVEGVPVVRTAFEALGLECALTAFVAPLDGVPVAICSCELVNPGLRVASAAVVVSVRPANVETLCAINRLEYDPSSRTFRADGETIACLGSAPDHLLLSDYPHGDVAMQLRDGRLERRGEAEAVDEPFGLATGAAVFDVELAAGEAYRVAFTSPLQAGTRPPLEGMFPAGDSDALVDAALSGQLESWKELTGDGMRVSIPEEAFQRAFDVNKAYLLLLFDGRSITPGVSTYHMMWFRDAAYLVPALDKIGRADMAADVLSTYPDRQTPDGYFKSHSGEWDSNGQAMYTLVHHWKITRDDSFVKEIYPSLMKGARWIDSHLMAGLPVGDPRRGLLPPGISAEHFGMGDTYYWDDLWAVGGLLAARDVALELEFHADAGYLERLAARIWDALESSWASVERRLGRKVIPIAPGRDVDSGSIGVVSAVYPLRLMRASEEIMRNTLDEIIDRHFYRDAFYHAILHCGLNAYLTLQVAQCLLDRREPYALEVFESLAGMATPTLTFPEAINPLTGGGAYGDGHHGWAVCEFVNFLRNVMLLEEDDRLVLLPLAKEEWFAPGNTVGVERAPTFFGEVSYAAACSEDSVTFEICTEPARAPSRIEINLPFAFSSCRVDGNRVDLSDGARRVEVPGCASRVRLGIE